MRRVDASRQDLADLLVRRPRLDRAQRASATLVRQRRVDQFRVLFDLYERGLLSFDELERQLGRIIRH